MSVVAPIEIPAWTSDLVRSDPRSASAQSADLRVHHSRLREYVLEQDLFVGRVTAELHLSTVPGYCLVYLI